MAEGITRHDLKPRWKGSPERDYLGSNRGRTGRKSRSLGELPDPGKLGRNFGGDEELRLKLRHRSLNYRRQQRKNEKWLGDGRGLLLTPVAPILNRTAPIATTISCGGRFRIYEATTLEKIKTRDSLQCAVHGRQTPEGQDGQRNYFGEFAHGT